MEYVGCYKSGLGGIMDVVKGIVGAGPVPPGASPCQCPIFSSTGLMLMVGAGFLGYMLAKRR